MSREMRTTCRETSWFQIASAIAMHEGWMTKCFFQGGESYVAFTQNPGVLLKITIDRQIGAEIKHEDMWELLYELYFKTRRDGISLEQAELEAVVNGCNKPHFWQ